MQELAGRVAFVTGGASGMVVHAIRTGEFYIFTHAELREISDARSDKIAQSCARWSEYCDQHGVSA
jgi:hypothetical protein